MLTLCRAFHCLPSQVLAEDARLLRLLDVERIGAPPQQEDDMGGGYE